MDEYRVSLDVYNGPLDLLLHLIRRDEVDIYDIPIARITGQYLEYVAMLKAIDLNLAGEFMVMAATLMEIKSQMLLPRPEPGEAGAEEYVDPRLELVRQLLEYKNFKDVAHQLGDAASSWSSRYGRGKADIRRIKEEEEPELDLESVTTWDLLDAFSRLLEATAAGPAMHEVIYDDTPVDLHAADIVDRLRRDGNTTFAAIFEGRSRSEMVGLFLALLELIRQKRIRVEQDGALGQIYVSLVPEQEAAALREAEARALREAVEQQPETVPAATEQAPDESGLDESDATEFYFGRMQDAGIGEALDEGGTSPLQGQQRPEVAMTSVVENVGLAEALGDGDALPGEPDETADAQECDPEDPADE